MSKEKETEKIISDKLNSREFAFDEKAWAGMETLLDAQQKKRRFGFLGYFSASIFVILVAGAVWLITSTKEIDKKAIAYKQNTNDFRSKAKTVELNATDFAQNTTDSQPNTKDIEQNTTDSQPNTKEIEQNTADSQLNTKEIEQNTADSQLNTKEIEQNTADSQLNTKEIEQNTADSQLNTKEIGQNSKDSTFNTKDLEQNNIDFLQKDIPFFEQITDSAKAAEHPILTDSASLAETAKNLLTAPGKETKNAWGVLAGVGAWKPYQIQMQGEENKDMIGFTGGIYYQRTCAKLIDLSFGILYSSRGGLNYDKTIVNSEYGFGVESNKTIISPQTLHYLNIPLTLRFNISQRSHVQIGAEYYHLMATTSKISYITENSFGISEPYSEERQTGNHLGFRKYDIAAFLGYEFTLLDRMNAALQLHYGFYDNTDINYYAGEIFGRNANGQNISLQLHLKYDLIRH